MTPAFTCQRCGQLVHGTYHVCPAVTSWPQTSPAAKALDPTPTLTRIANALERIAHALEHQPSPPPPERKPA